MKKIQTFIFWGVMFITFPVLSQVDVPKDFPVKQDTGRPEEDEAKYAASVNQWILKNPERYAQIKISMQQNGVTELKKTVPITTTNTSNKPHFDNAKRWVLKSISIHSTSLSSSDLQNRNLEKFTSQYFQEGSILMINENNRFQLSQKMGVFYGIIEEIKGQLIMKVSNENCEDCYTVFSIQKTIQSDENWTWYFQSEFEGDDTIFELNFLLQ